MSDTVPVYYCLECPETFPNAESSNAHHDATGHHQTWRPTMAFRPPLGDTPAGPHPMCSKRFGDGCAFMMSNGFGDAHECVESPGHRAPCVCWCGAIVATPVSEGTPYTIEINGRRYERNVAFTANFPGQRWLRVDGNGEYHYAGCDQWLDRIAALELKLAAQATPSTDAGAGAPPHAWLIETVNGEMWDILLSRKSAERAVEMRNAPAQWNNVLQHLQPFRVVPVYLHASDALTTLHLQHAELSEANAELEAELHATSHALGEGPYSSISQHATALVKSHAEQAAKLKELEAEVDDFEAREMACCPDMPFEEYIASLHRWIATLESQAAEQAAKIVEMEAEGDAMRKAIGAFGDEELNCPAASIVEALRNTSEAIGEACGSKMIGVVHIEGPSGRRSIGAYYDEMFNELATRIETALTLVAPTSCDTSPSVRETT